MRWRGGLANARAPACILVPESLPSRLPEHGGMRRAHFFKVGVIGARGANTCAHCEHTERKTRAQSDQTRLAERRQQRVEAVPASLKQES